MAYQFELGRIALMRFHEMLDALPTAELSGTEAFPKKWSQLTVNHLSFAYESNKVLKELSFTVKRGEKIGIVGLSGAGKSTLFKLLLKLYDRYEGSITFEGQELKDIKRESYLQHFSYVPQETELFNLSLKDNITLALDQEVNEEHFKKAIEIAHVKDFLHKLPKGVDSLIGEKGVKLSGGERQRVGIARAVYKNPELLFFG
ncbi:ABC transporter ATP-binding protein [Candidatus Peregrinibacteria bacterium]|nr:MAG: ABC transporter ATP-binding protein [Candidatus Peregrinibacteria bacterium]